MRLPMPGFVSCSTQLRWRVWMCGDQAAADRGTVAAATPLLELSLASPGPQNACKCSLPPPVHSNLQSSGTLFQHIYASCAMQPVFNASFHVGLGAADASSDAVEVPGPPAVRCQITPCLRTTSGSMLYHLHSVHDTQHHAASSLA